jgi:hypothetical protein
MWRCVDSGLTDVSEELINSVFRVQKSARVGTSVSRWLQTEPTVGNTSYMRTELIFDEAIGTAATPGLLCQPRVIVKMIVEKQM